jgi:hypothetical protein
VAAEIKVELADRRADRGLPSTTEPSRRATTPEVHTIESLAGASGAIGAGDGLIALTRQVGMHVPGRDSLLSSFDVTIGDRSQPLAFRVVTADERFSRVVIELTGALEGMATAFVRARPVEPEMGSSAPDRHEFSGQRWLVVGGSRGLGAIAVLLLDAGGADVRFTFRAGADDAVTLAARSSGATPYQLDVEGGLDRALPAVLDGWQPTHLAYMASPPIFVGAAGVYSPSLFERFRHVYVDAFLDLVGRLQLDGVVWPSSIAVDDPPAGMAEYADAKLAGEEACRTLAAERPELRIATPRLPRLLTDQTTSFVPVEFGDGPAEVLAALRDVTPWRGR